MLVLEGEEIECLVWLPSFPYFPRGCPYLAISRGFFSNWVRRNLFQLALCIVQI